MSAGSTWYQRGVDDPATERRRTWLASGVDRCHRLIHSRGVVVSPEGTAIATAERVSESGQLAQSIGGTYPNQLLQHTGLTATRMSPPDHRLNADDCRRFCWALLRLHTDLLSTLLTAARHRLDHRTAEGSSLLSRQLVQGHIADVAVAVVESLALAESAPDCAPAGRTHRRLVQAGRTLLPLFGASGFLVSGPGLDLHVMELIGNVYLPVSGRTAGD